MRVGIIDLGTNSVRFDVHQIGPGDRLRQLHREKLMVRLGQGVFVDGRLDSQAIRRTLEAFASFKATAEALQTDKVIAFGTSALREAADGEKLVDQVRARTGFDIKIISGEEEARLIALGVLSHEKPIKGRLALVDIGGGSTEISICRGYEVQHSESFNLGTARLQQVFLKSSPPKGPEPIRQLRRYIKSVLLPKFIADEWPKIDQVVGSSGTIKALEKILKKSAGTKNIERGELKKLVREMSGMTTTQLLNLPGMEARRVDMILAGAVLLEECMEALGAKRCLTTDFSLRDGILEEQVQLVQAKKKSGIAFHLDDLYAKALRFGRDDAHLQKVVSLSDSLFDRLRPLHRLKPEWKVYLIAAAVLHDVGEAVTPTHHEQHSYYIVKHANFPSMEAWETEFVAQLCLHHRNGRPDLKDLDFGNAKENKVRREAFLKLLALLRVADALDRSHQATVTLKAVEVSRDGVRLKVAARSHLDLELLRIEQKKDLFEDVFRKKLAIFVQGSRSRR